MYHVNFSLFPLLPPDQVAFTQFIVWTVPLTTCQSGLTFFYSPIFIVDLLLKAVGDTPIMKQKKWAVEGGRTVQSLSQFISRFLKLDAGEQLVRIKIVGFTKKISRNTSGFEFFIYTCGFFLPPQFIYVNQSFAPSPDQDVGTLYDVSTHRDLLLNSTQNHDALQVGCKIPNLIGMWDMNTLIQRNIYSCVELTIK